MNFLPRKFISCGPHRVFTVKRDACDQASLQGKGAGRHPVAILGTMHRFANPGTRKC